MHVSGVFSTDNALQRGMELFRVFLHDLPPRSGMSIMEDRLTKATVDLLDRAIARNKRAKGDPIWEGTGVHVMLSISDLIGMAIRIEVLDDGGNEHIVPMVEALQLVDSLDMTLTEGGLFQRAILRWPT